MTMAVRQVLRDKEAQKLIWKKKKKKFGKYSTLKVPPETSDNCSQAAWALSKI